MGKLRIVARIPEKNWKEKLELTGYRIIEKKPEGYILQWGHDKPGLWIPGTDKSYQIIIEGIPHEFAGNVEVPGWSINRPIWIQESEEAHR